MPVSKVLLQMLDGEFKRHNGPAITDYALISRFTFAPVNRLLCGCCAKKKKTTTKIEHDELWSFPAGDVPTVWKMFKPYWKAELSEAEYA